MSISLENLPKEAQHLLVNVHPKDNSELVQWNEGFLVNDPTSVKDVLFSKQDCFQRDTDLTKWAELKSLFPDSTLTLLREIGEGEGIDSNLIRSIVGKSMQDESDLSEDSLAMMLLEFFLGPYSELMNSEDLRKFHVACVYFENVRSGKIDSTLHHNYFHQKSRENISSFLFEKMSSGLEFSSEKEKLFSAVIHSSYRSLLNLIGWCLYFFESDDHWVRKASFVESDEKKKRIILSFVYEVLRVYPSAWILHRKVRSPVKISDKRLEVGDDVYVPILNFHRSSNYFRDAQKFNPNRFIKDNKFHNPWWDFTFGTGRRKCLGESVARIENFLFFANLLKNFKLQVPDGEPLSKKEPVDGMTIGPHHFSVKFTSRK